MTEDRMGLLGWWEYAEAVSGSGNG